MSRSSALNLAMMFLLILALAGTAWMLISYAYLPVLIKN